MSKISLRPLVVVLLATLLALGLLYDLFEALRVYRQGWVAPLDEFFTIDDRGSLIYRTYTESESRLYFLVFLIFALVQVAIALFLWREWRRRRPM
jgi:hypothetical protein